MSGGAGSLHRLTAEQSPGVAPRDNIWLSASAGTGKTQVLTARVLRLLLSGVHPGAILGLSFTKAGASEMAQRVRSVLAEWVQLADKDLRKQLMCIGAAHLDPLIIDRARSLFAEVIDAPGQGLAFQTIHSFCQSLLGAFPLEAGLVPGFRAIEDREAVLLRREVLNQLADNAARDGNLPFLRDLGLLSERLGEADTLAWLDRCAKASDAWRTLPADVAPWLRKQFDLPQSDPDDWLIRQCEDDVIDRAGWQELALACAAWSPVKGGKWADAIAGWLAASPTQRASTIDAVIATVFTGKGTVADPYSKGLASVADIAERVGDAARTARQTAIAMAASDRFATALSAGRIFAVAWAIRKQRDALADFDDLIAHTLAMLSTGGQAEWIRYKLDQRIDHILVDEAQDTNADQWSIVKALTDEYFAGEGARDPALRTLFVVGDYKQAIFGFQGTDPRHFSLAEAYFREKGEQAERPFEQLSIDTSFRSAPAVLDAVDAVMQRLGPVALGLAEDADVHHMAVADRKGGAVTLWPPESPTNGETVDDAGEDADEPEEGWIDNATLRIADRIARQVRDWIDTGLDGEPVVAGDVLVLVRSRKELAGLIVARLQAAGVAVAGVDRLRLHKPLAVQDLLAAARFAIQPLDNLNCANLLVSPLGGFTQDDLWRYGTGRGKRALWPHLRKIAEDQPDFAARLGPLYALLGMADYASPHRFFETILSGPLQGRAKLLARLGNAALDPIEELLSAALTIGTRNGPSLHHFLQWFDSGDIEIKRETDVAGGEARVMTVHGAKGLEARLVILADATANPKSRGKDKGFDWSIPDGPTIPVLGMKTADRPALLAAAHEANQARELREHWRLLYVAMTRARERLFVTGALAKTEKDGPAEESWYTKIAGALGDLGAVDRDDTRWGSARVYPPVPAQASQGVAHSASSAIVAPHAVLIPAWARVAAPDEPRPLRPLAPSKIGEETALAVPLAPARDTRAARRGTLIHALFERLPAVAVDQRHGAARRWLDAQAADFTPEARENMASAALSVLADATHAALFGVDSLGEVPFSALVDGRVIAGTADRLLVTKDCIAVIDFKTGASVPDGPDSVPLPYLRQMAAYAAALAVIFPDRTVDAALLYTGGPRLITLPPALLAAHRPALAEQ